MSLIDEIVDITIKRDTIGITSAGLNTLLILGDSKKADQDVKRVKAYGNMSEVVLDYAANKPEYRCANLAFGQSQKPTKILIGQCFNLEAFAEAYTKVSLENNDFYGVVITSKASENQLAIAGLVEAEERIFGLSSDDSNILNPNDTTNILHQLKALNRQRTFVIYNKDADLIYPEAAWFGLMFTKEAGSATWAYKNLSGFKSYSLSSDNRNAISGKNGNYYVSFGGVDVMLDGKTAKGEYIDIVQGLDWLSSDMKTRVANALISSDKIPYTNQGIAVIESMVRNSLNEAAQRDIIDRTSINVTVPDVLSVSPENRLNRILPDVKFEARLAGAIHKIKIQGTVTV